MKTLGVTLEFFSGYEVYCDQYEFIDGIGYFPINYLSLLDYFSCVDKLFVNATLILKCFMIFY